jgi:hypothetical protein
VLPLRYATIFRGQSAKQPLRKSARFWSAVDPYRFLNRLIS